MSIAKKSHKNSFSFIFGLLCVGVVYLHSGWAGGFKLNTLGLDNYAVQQIVSMLLMSIVPSFFILWGYLSAKYISSSDNPLEFVKKKILQFYPIYLFSFTLVVVFRLDYMLELEPWKVLLAFLGLYYESGLWGGGHIYLVVLSVVITISIFKLLKLGIRSLIVYCFVCLLLSKFLPHESDLCYVRYFGYYTAFFLGILYKQINLYDDNSWLSNKPASIVIMLVFFIGLLTPILNYFGVYLLELEYNPNSPEQLFLCSFMLFLVVKVFDKLPFISGNGYVTNVIHHIGNNAYGHFIFQSHVIRSIIFLNAFAPINPVILQLMIILCTSCIVVYIVLPIYKRLESALIR